MYSKARKLKVKTIVQKAPGITTQKLLICVLLLAAMLMLQAQAADEEDAAAPKSSAYVSLGEPMVLNLSGAKRLTFLQLSADVLVGDANAEDTIKLHVPAIRHSLIMGLSEQNAGDIKSPAKREEIRQQITTNVKALIADLSGSEEVSDILFSSILVQ